MFSNQWSVISSQKKADGALADISPGMKTTVPLCKQRYIARVRPCFFDIVNGFLIDAVAHRASIGGASFPMSGTFAAHTDVESG